MTGSTNLGVSRSIMQSGRFDRLQANRLQVQDLLVNGLEVQDLDNELVSIMRTRGYMIVGVGSQPGFFGRTVNNNTVVTQLDDGSGEGTTVQLNTNVTPIGLIGDLLLIIAALIFGDSSPSRFAIADTNTTTRFELLNLGTIDMSFHYNTKTFTRMTQQKLSSGKIVPFDFGPAFYQALVGISAEPVPNFTIDPNDTLEQQLIKFSVAIAAAGATQVSLRSSPDCTASVAAENIKTLYGAIMTSASGIPVVLNPGGSTEDFDLYLQDDWVHSVFFPERTVRFTNTLRPQSLLLLDNYCTMTDRSKLSTLLNSIIDLAFSALYDLDKNGINTLTLYNASLAEGLIQAQSIRDLGLSVAIGMPGNFIPIPDFGRHILNTTGSLSTIIARNEAPQPSVIDFSSVVTAISNYGASAQ